MLYFEVVLVVLLMLVLRVYRLRGGLCYKIIQPHLQEIATMKFLNLNDAFSAAFSIALDRMNNVELGSLVITMGAGDGASLSMKNAHKPEQFVEVSIGGAACDMEEPYYEIFSVETFGI